MAIIIHGNIYKPINCLYCPFNRDDCFCSITGGEIDRDYWDCSNLCPIEEVQDITKDKDEVKNISKLNVHVLPWEV